MPIVADTRPIIMRMGAPTIFTYYIIENCNHNHILINETVLQKALCLSETVNWNPL